MPTLRELARDSNGVPITGGIFASTISMFTDEIAASGTAESEEISMHGKLGIASIQADVVGDGSVTLSLLRSNDGVTYVEQVLKLGADTVGAGLTVGTSFVDFDLPLSAFIKFKATEAGGLAAVTPNVTALVA